MSEIGAFARQMQLAPGQRPGSYTVEVDPMWNCPLTTHGGTVAALLALAMTNALERPELSLRSIATSFAAPVGPGPVEVDVTVTRQGRSMSYVRAEVRNAGADSGATASAVFGADRPTFEFNEVTRPEVLSYEESFSWGDDLLARGEPLPDDRNKYWDHVQFRRPRGPWTETWTPTSVESAWIRHREPPMRDDGTLDPLLIVAYGDMMTGSVGRRMGPGHPRYLTINADLTTHIVNVARSEWLLIVDRALHAGGGYALLQGELWDEHGTLVAYSTTTMVLMFPDGAPSEDQRQAR